MNATPEVSEWKKEHMERFFDDMQTLLDVAEGRAPLENWNDLVSAAYKRDASFIKHFVVNATLEKAAEALPIFFCEVGSAHPQYDVCV